jgi:hypothetical protein
VVREALADTGLGFIRRANPLGHDYFLVNLTAKAIATWVVLSVAADSATLLNPLTGDGGTAAVRRAGSGAQVYVQLAPGESLILRAWQGAPPTRTRWTYTTPGTPVDLTGSWRIEFVQGGPELLAPVTRQELTSWTELGAAAQRFAGRRATAWSSTWPR